MSDFGGQYPMGRRNFIKASAASVLLPTALAAAAGSLLKKSGYSHIKESVTYAWKSIPVTHLHALQKEFDRYKRNGAFSSNPTFRKYLSNKKFIVPDGMEDTRSLIIMAVFTRMMTARFHYQGSEHAALIPPQYYDDGITVEQLEQLVLRDIVKRDGFWVRRHSKLNLKFLAAHTGLGFYGRNNIIFVPGMGSFITLYAFFTDCDLNQDDWLETIRLMPECATCRTCIGMCPSGALPRTGMVLDAGRCITLYNEIEGSFPSWIKPEWHNALMGCMTCQLCCPVNKALSDSSTGELEAVSEDETRCILAGTVDAALVNSLTRKLMRYHPATDAALYGMFKRNLASLLH
ncbi:hypothetical protein JXO52_01740 [bacterium]|nr:hypothetical protein [bacterium]